MCHFKIPCLESFSLSADVVFTQSVSRTCMNTFGCTCIIIIIFLFQKNEPVTIINFDDIYYVMSDSREPAFYPRNVSAW